MPCVCYCVPHCVEKYSLINHTQVYMVLLYPFKYKICVHKECTELEIVQRRMIKNEYVYIGQTFCNFCFAPPPQKNVPLKNWVGFIVVIFKAVEYSKYRFEVYYF